MSGLSCLSPAGWFLVSQLAWLLLILSQGKQEDDYWTQSPVRERFILLGLSLSVKQFHFIHLLSLLSLYLLSRGWTRSPRNLGLTAFAPLPLVERLNSLAACFSRLNSRLNAEWDRTTYWWTYCYFFFLLISGGKEEGVWFLNSVFVFPWPRLDWTVRRRNLSCPCWWFLK